MTELAIPMLHFFNFRTRILAGNILRTALLLLTVAWFCPPLAKACAEYEIKALPLLIAHRAGTADYPENTLLAIEQSLKNGADGLWLSVQLSQDGVPVLYRPIDLSLLTNGAGPVSSKTVNELVKLNVGWHFKQQDGSWPYRAQPQLIPTLEDALASIPLSVLIFLDMKSLPAQPLLMAVAGVLDRTKNWGRVVLYSTEDEFQSLFADYPQAQIAESRDMTRARFLNMALADECSPAGQAGKWSAFEYERRLEVVEKFTLGEGKSSVLARAWKPTAMLCMNSRGAMKSLVIGISSKAQYEQMACMGVSAVLVDSPKKMQAIRRWMILPLRCKHGLSTQKS